MLSLGMPGIRSRIVPSARTASNPSICARIGPWRTTLTPPAFVATRPPIVAESRAPRSMPTSQPAARAAVCASARVTPDAAVISPASASRSVIWLSRRMLMTTSPPRGTEPPTSPVLPPCGTTPTPALPHAIRIAATSLTVPGLTTATRLAMESARPVGLVRGSQRGVDEAVSFADDVAKGLPQSVRGHDRIVAVRRRATLEARYIEGTSREAASVPDHRRARYIEGTSREGCRACQTRDLSTAPPHEPPAAAPLTLPPPR